MMNEFPLITVITPSFNNSQTIIPAIDSVLSQSYENIEFIIIDDGSSDNTNIEELRLYIENHKKNNIKRFLILNNNRNLGTTKTLNRGIAESQGEYIYTLAADDCFEDSEVLSDWTKEFIRTGAEVITAKRAVYNETMTKFKYLAPSEEHINLIKTSEPKELFDKMAGYNFIFSCCTARTRACYKSSGGLDERYRLIDDYPLNMRLLRKGIKFYFFDRVVIRYRLGGVSNANKIDLSYIHASDKLFFREILPFVHAKCKAFSQYAHWRRKIKCVYDERRYRAKFFAKGITPSRQFMYRIIMCFKHPFYMVNKKFFKNHKQ